MAAPPVADPAESELAADHAFLCEAVREAGALSLRYFRHDPKVWEKNPGDPVSEADLAVNELLRERLCTRHPDDGWLSEESADDPVRLAKRRVWIVDPIDGTRPFLRGLAEYTVCAGLAIDGRPRLAAVFNPATDEFFDAVGGGGARCNGADMVVSNRADLDGAHISSNQTTVARHLPEPDGALIRIAKLGSIAYRLALVALGRHDACVSLAGKNDWDIAAADLLVTEAGGRVTTPEGAPFSYNRESIRHAGLIAAGPKLHAVLMSKLRAL